MTIEERFKAKIALKGECIEWTASNVRGYGQMWANGRQRRATHIAIMLETGKWPESGKIVCHHCDNPKCVRFDHLYVGTQVENQRDTFRRGPTPIPKMVAAWKSRTHCHQGHPYHEQPKLDFRGFRTCPTCNLLRSRRQDEKRKSERHEKRIRAALEGRK